MPVDVDLISAIGHILVASLGIGKPCTQMLLQDSSTTVGHHKGKNDAHLGDVLLSLRLIVGLIELGEFFDIGEVIDLEDVLGVERMVVHDSNCVLRILGFAELDENITEGQ